ncbi:MAG: DUF411 domain-containing protein [Pseudomonadota bacterium]
MKLRKKLLIVAGASLAALGATSPAAAAVVNVVKSPTCGCCEKWIDHVRKAGHIVKVENGDPSAEATRAGVPANLRSCHTSSVGRYTLEGHVPAEDIARLLREKPDAAGIAVAGMPAGAPGMEHGDHKEPFQTILFDRAGKTRVFASH